MNAIDKRLFSICQLMKKKIELLFKNKYSNFLCRKKQVILQIEKRRKASHLVTTIYYF